ncbi:hypothetical protein WN51_08231 [Melipona quadrifasciata]|uniref:Uncharacterized protein n=1 Tax=Melipona quadrifasciata TaxID=166423 RepID=A0A0M8ZMM6_9HYME|nr:hypothetical protein WN51_08231 [Melipona quadrifasciata]
MCVYVCVQPTTPTNLPVIPHQFVEERATWWCNHEISGTSTAEFSRVPASHRVASLRHKSLGYRSLPRPSTSSPRSVCQPSLIARGNENGSLPAVLPPVNRLLQCERLRLALEGSWRSCFLFPETGTPIEDHYEIEGHVRARDMIDEL